MRVSRKLPGKYKTVFINHFMFPSSVGWGVDQSVGGFGDEPGIKVQLMNLIRSVRTVMRGGSPPQTVSVHT